ncbi:MAG: hypothetical protein ABEJ31_02135 [Haloarculaceae archaeon]
MTGDADRRAGPGLDRRRVLAGLAGVGGLGALSGVGTAAFLRDGEGLTQRLSGGTLDLDVAWETPADCGESDGRVPLTLALTPRDRSGHGTVDLTLPTSVPGQNPAALWLRTTCPTPPSPLDDALRVELWNATTAGDRAGASPLLAGTLREVLAAGVVGLPLDAAGDRDGAPDSGTCLAPGEVRRLRLEWALPRDYAGPDASTQTTLAFAAVQCRHDAGATNPFASVDPADCGDDPEPSPDPDSRCYAISDVAVSALVDGKCVFLGKLDVNGRLAVGDTYPLDGSGYELRVTDVALRDGEVTAVAFTVVGPSGETPELCEVAIKGGPTVATYGPDSLTGNATDGLLGAPTNPNGAGGPGGRR